MTVPAGLKYSKTHEWVKSEGNVVLVGITDHAQHELTDIVYVDDFPGIGERVEQGMVISVIESVKAVSDVYAPVSGTLLATNPDVETDPARVNNTPYDAWIVKIQVEDPSQLDDLLDAAAYSQLISS